LRTALRPSTIPRRSMTLERATSNVVATVFTGNLPDLAIATARSVFLPVRGPALP
jgi:hypothetical protein